MVLREQLQAILQFDDIDLVAVDERSSPILRFEAVSGRSIYCRDSERRAEFVSLTAREYEDEMAFLRRGLAGQAGLRFTPELRFLIDESVVGGFRVQNLLDNATDADPDEGGDES